MQHPVLTVHHIRQQKDGGSDRPENLVTLCNTCHEKHHDGTKPLSFRAPQALRDATQFNVVKAYVMRATTHLNRSVTFGYLTKARRREMRLPKSHINDALMNIGQPIELRCGAGTKRDPHTWIPAYAGRTTPARLFYRWQPDGNDLGPLRLDCEGKTWRRVGEW